jgi:hypothetical protein
MLRAWLPQLDALHLARGDAHDPARSGALSSGRRVLRWAIDVDPLTI